MPIKLMLVDDSTVVRGMITRHLKDSVDIAVVATATNGAQAIEVAATYKPDIIILDIEMPEMDGITALPKLLAASPGVKIIMASALTLKSADITLKALALGASDCVAKPSTQTPNDLKMFFQELEGKILSLANIKPSTKNTTSGNKPASFAPIGKDIKALAIASSTGGPLALQTLFQNIKGRLTNIPIFITQHMPPMFTTMLANNLTSCSARTCNEATNGQFVEAGQTYLAPGDYHMLAEKKEGRVVISLNQKPLVNFCRPSADPMIESLVKIYGRGLLVLVLTGMGQDGFEGAKIAHKAGATIIAQDEATSVVWGMPKAVATNNLCSAVLPLPEIHNYLIKNIG